MTARQAFNAMLIECTKQKTTPLLLEDFNYLFNKTIRMFCENVYHAYEINQKVSDDLRVLSGTAKLDVKKVDFYGTEFSNGLTGAIYECNLPLDYMHLLGCVCIFKVNKTFECYDKDQYVKRIAERSTVDKLNALNEDYYLRPSVRKPYFIIKNVNTSEGTHELPTQPLKNGDTLSYETEGNDGELPKTIKIGGQNVDLVEKPAVNRYGNASPIRLEIRYGNDDTLFQLEKVVVDYMRTPQNIRLTQRQMDLVEDTSQILEFPDITCQQIINRFAAIYLENTSDQRLQTNMQVNQGIINGVPDGVQPQQQS